MKKLILTKNQANYLLHNIPAGHVIRIMVKDLDTILDWDPITEIENVSGGTVDTISQLPQQSVQGFTTTQ